MVEADHVHRLSVEVGDNPMLIAFLEGNTRDPGLEFDSYRRNTHTYNRTRLCKQAWGHIISFETKLAENLHNSVDVFRVDCDSDVPIARRPGITVKSNGLPPTTRYSTFFSLSNLKNSLKSCGNWVVAIGNLAKVLKGPEALRRRLAQPEGLFVAGLIN